MSFIASRRSVVVSVAILIGSLSVGGAIYAQRSGRLSFTRATKSLGNYTLGEELRGKLDLVLRLRMSRAPDQEMHLTGTLSSTPVDIRDGVVEVAEQIEGAVVSFKGAAAADAETQRAQADLAAGLGRRFYVRHRPDGAALAVHFERGYNPANANILLTIISSAQFVTATPEQPTWTAVERDGNGEFLAAYAKTAPGRVTKRKLRYLSEAKPQSSSVASRSVTPQLTIERGQYEVSLSDSGRLSGIEGTEQVSIALGALGMSMSTETRLRLTESVMRERSDLIGEFERAKQNYVLQPIEVMSEDPRVRRAYEDRMVLKSATLDELWKELLALADPNDSARSATVVRRFEAIFRLQESTIADALGRLPRTGELNGKLVLDALSLAQTQSAQNALAAIAQGHEYAPLQREYAIRYLSHQESPNDACLAAIKGLLDDADVRRRQFARFAYGTLASRIAEKAPETAHEIVRTLIEKLPSAANDSELGDLYLALGNSADPKAFPVLRSAATGGSGILRATAIEAVGRINDPAVVPLLSELLQSSEERVRMAAISGIQRREIGPFLPALVETAKHDKSADVRSAAVELLGAELSASPRLREVLIECAKNDAEAKVRQAAARQLRPTAPQSG